VRRAYRTLYRAGLSLEEARDALAKAALDAPLLAPLVAFLSESGRGIVR
jgi:UDP-N-acetylglucosamine acyltransferase